VAQLANFSAVEQQVKTNDVLAQIQGLLGGASATGLTSWIGTDVRALRDAEFVGTPIDVFIAPKTGADSAALVVKNANGETVQTLPVSLDEDVVQWAGVADDGTPLPSGTYSLRLESFQGDQKIGDTQVPIYSKVREARIDGDKTLLVLGDGSIIAADQVTAIRGSLQPNL
jgi:flagellar basal-body rod modification protein FlgD